MEKLKHTQNEKLNKKDQIKEEIMEETLEEIDQEVTTEEQYSLEDFNPLNKPVVEKGYTKKIIEANIGQSAEEYVEESIPEPTYERPEMEEEEIDFEEPKPSSSKNTSPPPKPESFSTNHQSFSGEDNMREEPRPSVNPPLDDLSNKEKKKAAKKSADAILVSYQKFFPVPFKKLASFNMTKLNRLDMNGEIRLSMPVREDGTTVRSHCEQVNRQVEETIVVTDEMVEELREPLIDVLMEQELALTPTQRLLMAGGGQVIQLLVPTLQIALSNREALKTFKEFKAQEDETRGEVQDVPVEAPPTGQPNETTVEDIQNEETISTGVEDAEILEEEIYEEPVGLDDYLDGDNNKDFDNEGVTIEEVANE